MSDLPLGSPCDLSSEAEDLEDELDSYLSVGEASATEVVYVREHVCVWPSRDKSIPGRLSLVKQHCVLFMAWLPYGTGVLREDGSFQVDAKEGAGHEGGRGASQGGATEVRLLRAHTPMLGPHRLDVTLISGLTLPPLHLPATAIHSLLEVIKQHVAIVASSTSKGTYLVNEVADPLVRSLSALDLGDVLLGGPPRGGAQLTWAPPAPPPEAMPQQAPFPSTWVSWVQGTDTVWDVYTVEQGTGFMAARPFYSGDVPAMPGVQAVTGIGRAAWRALSTGLSRLVAEYSGPVQHGSEDGTGEEGPGVGADETPAVQTNDTVSWQKADGVAASGQQRAASAAAACMAVGTLATCGSPPNAGRCTAPAAAGLAGLAGLASPQKPGTALGSSQVLSPEGVAHGVSPMRTGIDKIHKSTSHVSSGTLSAEDEDYELVDRNIQTLRDAHLHAPEEPPMTEDDLEAMMDTEGRLSGLSRLRERCWQSGLDPGARRLAWPLLLGLRASHHTTQEHKVAMASRRKAYAELCQQWGARIRENAPDKDKEWWESCSSIDKDVGRTDRAHPVFKVEGSGAAKALRRLLLSHITQPGSRNYCQGMSDLAAPLLVVLADESEAFAAFNVLMSHMGANFDSEQQGMHAQLAALRRLVQLVDPPLYAHLDAADCLSFFFCFRWLLISFKREFKYEDVLRLWEALWCAPNTHHMHLFLAAAVLVHHRKAIMSQVHDFDGMLKFCIQLSGALELAPLLRLAQALCTYVGRAADDVLLPLPVSCQHAQQAGFGAQSAGGSPSTAAVRT